MARRWFGWGVAGLVSAALFFSACGDDDGGSDTQAGGAATQAAASDSTPSVEMPPQEPPTEISVSKPLEKAPPSGKKLIWLQCELPICARFATGIEQGTKALGWSMDTIVYKRADPGPALQQAIQQKPDFVAITGIPSALMKPQLAAAAAANIPVMNCSAPEQPSPEGYAAVCATSLEQHADYIGRWAINDAGGSDAHVLGVTVKEIPAFDSETEWFENDFKSLCDTCTYDELAITAEDIGAGAVGQKVVAALQTNPDVNYVYFMFSDAATGVSEAIAGASMTDRVKLIGAAADGTIIKNIGKTQAAWTIQPQAYMGMVMVDAAARIASGQKLDAEYQKSIDLIPTWVIDSKESVELLAGTGYDWPGPADYPAQFEELWKLDG